MGIDLLVVSTSATSASRTAPSLRSRSRAKAAEQKTVRPPTPKVSYSARTIVCIYSHEIERSNVPVHCYYRYCYAQVVSSPRSIPNSNLPDFVPDPMDEGKDSGSEDNDDGGVDPYDKSVS